MRFDPSLLAPGVAFIDGPDTTSTKLGRLPFRVLTNIPGAVEMRWGLTATTRDFAPWRPYSPVFEDELTTVQLHAYANHALYLATKDAQGAVTNRTVWFNRHWRTYKYLPGDNGFSPVSWEPCGGPDNLPFFWTDSSRWNFDEPDNSILAAIVYFESSGKPLIGLKNKTIVARFRSYGNLNGGGIHFDALGLTYPASPHNPRKHHPRSAMTPGDEVWSGAFEIPIGQDASDWLFSHDQPTGEFATLECDLDLNNISQASFSIRGFSSPPTNARLDIRLDTPELL